VLNREVQKAVIIEYRTTGLSGRMWSDKAYVPVSEILRQPYVMCSDLRVRVDMSVPGSMC
jgi:hypothetical protein